MSQKQKLLKVFQERSLNFQPPLSNSKEELFEWFELEVNLPQCQQICRVRFDENLEQLIWPLLIQYTEKAQTDFLTDCSEITIFEDILKEVLNSPAEWDPEHKFW